MCVCRVRREASLPLVSVHVSTLRGFSQYEQTNHHLLAHLLGDFLVTVGATVPQHLCASLSSSGSLSDTVSSALPSRYLLQSTAVHQTATAERDGRPFIFNEYLYFPHCPKYLDSSSGDLHMRIELKSIPESSAGDSNHCAQGETKLASGSVTFPGSTEVGTHLSRVVRLLDADRVLVGELDLELRWVDLGEEDSDRPAASFLRTTSRSKLRRSASRVSRSLEVGSGEKKEVRKLQKRISVDVGDLQIGLSPSEVRQVVSVLSSMRRLLIPAELETGGDAADTEIDDNSDKSVKVKEWQETTETAAQSPSHARSRRRPVVQTEHEDVSREAALQLAVMQGSRYIQGGHLSLCLGDINSREFTASILNK